MKKIAIVSLALISLLTIGCGKSKEEKQKEYELALGEYSKQYFETYINGKIKDENYIPEVSIASLKDSNEKMGTNYDLSKLETCTDESKARLILDNTRTSITKIEYEINCK